MNDYEQSDAHSNIQNYLQDKKFLKSLLRYVLYDYYPAINWKPEGIFAEDGDHPSFSRVVRRALKLHLDVEGANIHCNYDEDFPNKDVLCDEEHFEMIMYLKCVLEPFPFSNELFLDYFCRFAEYTALSYLYGVTNAPLLTLQVICIMMQGMRESGKIKENVWKNFEKYCEHYVQAGGFKANSNTNSDVEISIS